MKAALVAASLVIGAVADASPTTCRALTDGLDAVFADMHDGDKKQITVEGSALTIKPSGNNQSWVVNTVLDPVSCSANIDFNVPGKPGVPPVNLTATFWASASESFSFKEFEFTDPSGTLPAGPLNRWVELKSKAAGIDVCAHKPPTWKAVYADMHDGDKKEISISGTALTIKPSGNNQTWVIHSALDMKTCSASINFNVPGKPGPPPVNLQATFVRTMTADNKAITEFEFTDPSGTLAAKDFPLNHWVQIEVELTDGGKPAGSPVFVV